MASQPASHEHHTAQKKSSNETLNNNNNTNNEIEKTAIEKFELHAVYDDDDDRRRSPQSNTINTMLLRQRCPRAATRPKEGNNKNNQMK